MGGGTLHRCPRNYFVTIEDFERFSLGFGVVEVNSDKIDDGEVTKDFDEDLKKIGKTFLYCNVSSTTLLQTILMCNFASTGIDAS